MPADRHRRRETCAGAIVRRLATQAFRRPLTDKEFTRLLGFYSRGRAARDFDYGITKALEAILASPQFLLRVEAAPAQRGRRGSDLTASPLRAGVAAVVLSLGHRPRRGAAETGGQRRVGGARRAGGGPAGRPSRGPTPCRHALPHSGCGFRNSIASRPTRSNFLTPIRRSRSRCAARRNCSSTASCAKTAASSIC